MTIEGQSGWLRFSRSVYKFSFLGRPVTVHLSAGSGQSSGQRKSAKLKKTSPSFPRNGFGSPKTNDSGTGIVSNRTPEAFSRTHRWATWIEAAGMIHSGHGRVLRCRVINRMPSPMTVSARPSHGLNLSGSGSATVMEASGISRNNRATALDPNFPQPMTHAFTTDFPLEPRSLQSTP